MNTETEQTAPDKKACASSLRNVVDALYVLSGKWKLPLILSLLQSPMRFNQLQEALPGISPKVLAKELRDLELNEFIVRKVLPGRPVGVIYESTAYSKTLKSVLAELDHWGGNHRQRIKQSIRLQS